MALPVLGCTMDRRSMLVHIAADAGETQEKLAPLFSLNSKEAMVQSVTRQGRYEREREREMV